MSESRVVIDRLAAALGARSDSDLARRLGVRPSTVGSWRTRDTVPYAECVNLSRRDGISLDWLLSGRGPAPDTAPDTTPRTAPPTHGPEPDQERVFVPFYDVHHATQALGSDQGVQEPVAAYGATAATRAANPAATGAATQAFCFPARWLRQVVGLEPRHARVLIADGPSMRPEVNHGDLLILDTDIQARRPDGLYLFVLDGQVQVKKLHFLPGRIVRVVGSAAGYQDYEIELPRAARAGFEIKARVALHGRPP